MRARRWARCPDATDKTRVEADPLRRAAQRTATDAKSGCLGRRRRFTHRFGKERAMATSVLHVSFEPPRHHRAASAGFYVGRAVGGHRHHRDPRRAAAAGTPEGKGSGQRRRCLSNLRQIGLGSRCTCSATGEMPLISSDTSGRRARGGERGCAGDRLGPKLGGDLSRRRKVPCRRSVAPVIRARPRSRVTGQHLSSIHRSNATTFHLLDKYQCSYGASSWLCSRQHNPTACRALVEAPEGGPAVSPTAGPPARSLP
jgi:hypothetical protein